MENLMTAEEVASYLHLCKKTVYSLAKQGAIPSTTLGTNVRFSRAEIDKLLKTTAPNPKQFLVIDDNPAITRMIKQVLGSRGHFTLTAETGKEGVELVRECEFDKIFLDLRMPDIDGAETLRLIREINPRDHGTSHQIRRRRNSRKAFQPGRHRGSHRDLMTNMISTGALNVR